MERSLRKLKYWLYKGWWILHQGILGERDSVTRCSTKKTKGGDKKQKENWRKKGKGGKKERKGKDCPPVLARRKESETCRHVSIMKDEAGIPTFERHSALAESQGRNSFMRQPLDFEDCQTVTEFRGGQAI
jgi:hypothetical protein